MGKDAPSPPPVPDYPGAAKAQGEANIDAARATAKLSNPNVYSPYGNQTVTYDGDIPTVTQTLSPQSQQVLNAQNATKLGLADLSQQGLTTAQNVMGTPFQFGGPNVQTSLDTSGIARMPVNAGTTGQEAIMSRLEPSLARNRVSTETQLINQGLRPGSEAYDNAIKLVGQQENDARTQAVLQGLGLDISSNNQGFNQALQGGQFANTAQQQKLGQDIQERQMPLNEITALMSGSQIQNPQFGAYQGANVQAAPIANATAQTDKYNQNIYNQQVGSANEQNKGLFSLGGSGAMAAATYFSDRRLKSNIQRIGTHKLGIGIYEYDIMGKHEIGVMAQEVEKVMPEAICRHSSGYMMVNYGRINA